MGKGAAGRTRSDEKVFINVPLIETVGKSDCFAIYGAQVVAYGVFVALRELCGTVPECFVVSTADENPTEIDGIPIRTLDDCGLAKDALILVAVTELLQDEICVALDNAGLRNYIRIGAHEEHLLMSAYYSSVGRFPLLAAAQGVLTEFTTGNSFSVYIVRHHSNKPLVYEPPLNTWEKPIQAGAGLADIDLAQYRDDNGDNISQKNPQYAEATAIYWVWMNTDHTYKGIGHYRRRLVLDDAQVATLTGSDIDAVLPLPYICCPDALAQFKRFVSEDTAAAFCSSLKTLYPDKYGDYINILGGRYTYAYNLFAARCEVFDKLCQFMFPVLEHMERAADDIPELKTTRALAYSSELLTSLFFLSNADRLNIRHVEKAIYS